MAGRAAACRRRRAGAVAGDHHRTARRHDAARQLSGHHPGSRQRAGRVPAVPARRRRAPHRLERDRANRRDPRSRPDRRPRPRGVAGRRRLGGDALRHGRDGEGPGRPRRRRLRRIPDRAQQEPHRSGARRRAAHQADAAAFRPRPGAGDPDVDRLTTAVRAPRTQRPRRSDRSRRPAQPAPRLRVRHRRLRRRGVGRPVDPPGDAQRPAGDPDPRSPRARRATDRPGVARRPGDRRRAGRSGSPPTCSGATPRPPRPGSSSSATTCAGPAPTSSSCAPTATGSGRSSSTSAAAESRPSTPRSSGGDAIDFLEPQRLWLLVVVAALAVAYVAVLRWRRAATVRFTTVDLLDEIVPRRPQWRRHVVACLQLLGLSAGVIAIARPITTTTERIVSEGRIILALDVSLSMEATDVAPESLRRRPAGGHRLRRPGRRRRRDRPGVVQRLGHRRGRRRRSTADTVDEAHRRAPARRRHGDRRRPDRQHEPARAAAGSTPTMRRKTRRRGTSPRGRSSCSPTARRRSGQRPRKAPPTPPRPACRCSRSPSGRPTA